MFLKKRTFLKFLLSKKVQALKIKLTSVLLFYVNSNILNWCSVGHVADNFSVPSNEITM